MSERKTLVMLIICLLWGWATSSLAKQAPVQLIKKIVEAKVLEFNTRGRGVFTISSEPQRYYDETGRVVAFVQDITPRGFIVVAGDDALEPILGYSLTHDFLWDENPENVLYHLVKADAIQRINRLSNSTDAEKSRVREKWNRLASGKILEKAQTQTVWPPPSSTPTEGWVETLWHQHYPYNDRCPYDDANGGRSVVGCVATAMAQIMNFHGYPSSVAAFSDADDYTSIHGATETSNEFVFRIDDDCGLDNTLTWSDLNALLDYVTYPLLETSTDGLVDEFCYACGVSVNMNYSAVGSGCSTVDAADALKDRFGYATADWMAATDDDFLPTLKANMKQALPAEMSIKAYNPYKGHAIVVDGFDEGDPGWSDDFYHLNYGWGSQSNCWWWNLLPVESVTPPLPSDYTLVSGAVVNISPGFDFLTVENLGLSNLTVASITDDKPWLQVSVPQTLPIVLGPGERFQLGVSVTNWTSIGTQGEEATVAIHSDDPDEHPVTVTVVAHSQSSLLAPVADAGGTYSGTAHQPIQFNGSSSYDPDGSIVDYHWNFGDGLSDSGADLIYPIHTYTSAGDYSVILTVTDNDGLVSTDEGTAHVSTTAVEGPQESALPDEFALSQNFPNPFNPVTILRYQVPEVSHVLIEVYNMRGQKVKALLNEEKRAGYYEAAWDGKDEQGRILGSGVYMVRMVADGYCILKKVMLMK